MVKLLLFDVDGTLTPAMKSIQPNMVQMLRIKKDQGYALALVGGSDLTKIQNQLGSIMYELFDYIFSENGVVAYKGDRLIHSNSFVSTIGEINYSSIVNTILQELAKIELPIKRSNFIELRTAALNVSPIGRSCTYDERIQFNNYDGRMQVRKTLIENLQPMLNRYNLEAVIGGMISIDIYPQGWNKTYCLQHLPDIYEEIHFFGDKTLPGQNDYALYINSKVIGHSVRCPDDTIKLLKGI